MCFEYYNRKRGFEGYIIHVTVQRKYVTWEQRGRLPTETENIRDLFSLHMEKYPLRCN
jgi:hypothetical protein